MRKIPSGILPTVSKHCPVDDYSTTIGASSSRPATTELEVALLAVFESIGLSLPAQIEDLARTSSDSLKVFFMFTNRNRIHPYVIKVYTGDARYGEQRDRRARGS